MNLKNYYWYFKQALSPRICRDIIEYGLKHEEQIAYTGGIDPKDEKQLLNLQKLRKSNVAWLNDPWIYKEIQPFIHQANKLAGWNFQWDSSEACQFTKYKLNQFYDWHCDSWSESYDRPGTTSHGKIRKLSVTCQLTDGSEYAGGELEFDYRDYHPDKRKKKIHAVQCKEILPLGSIVVFPSHVWHRVKPVTSGTRYSLVIWNLGNPFI